MRPNDFKTKVINLGNEKIKLTTSRSNFYNSLSIRKHNFSENQKPHGSVIVFVMIFLDQIFNVFYVKLLLQNCLFLINLHAIRWFPGQEFFVVYYSRKMIQITITVSESSNCDSLRLKANMKTTVLMFKLFSPKSCEYIGEPQKCTKEFILFFQCKSIFLEFSVAFFNINVKVDMTCSRNPNLFLYNV